MAKNSIFTNVSSNENFRLEKTTIVNSSFQKRCDDSGINFSSVLKVPKKYVLIHKYLESGFNSIVAFSDSLDELNLIADSHPCNGSVHHCFYIKNNLPDMVLFDIKDSCLINICKNVADYLDVGEYAMLKNSYFKSAAWFEKAKNIASLGAEILYNY